VSQPQTFTIEWTDAAISDLRQRLAATRWPEQETVDDWSQGVPLSYQREVCEYWGEGYDFAAAQGRLNQFPQFRHEVDGLGIHFLHLQSRHADAMPLVLTHGWPGTFVEFLDAIDALANPDDPADAFHVVVPSLPGYAYSDQPTAPGWNVLRIARAWDTLMRDLGYGRYGAQGGDWGAMVTTSIGQQCADRVSGIHVNLPIVNFGQLDMTDLTEQEAAALARVAEHADWGMGYSAEQSTRPQTLGYGLTDSPAGQCAWILEKFWAWTDNDGHPEQALTKDQMLDNISLYWFSATAASSARLYWESFKHVDLEPITCPSGVSSYPKEILGVSERWARTRFTDLRWYGAPKRGGHFAAFEQPATFVDEVRGFFRTVR
jgi:pimeloyl-ACP methyl ester carboxylesterase